LWGFAVTVIGANDGQALTGAHVTVEDSAGFAHESDTNGSGLASFSNLSTGLRRSITVVSDAVVPALPGTGGTTRPKYEMTTVLNHCAASLTVPLRLTRSGEATLPVGVVTAKVPQPVFNMLPHSNNCTYDCLSDADCYGNYYCELDPNKPCGPSSLNPTIGRCTPKSLLPMFGLVDPSISGQFRMIMLVPVWKKPNQTYQDISTVFAPPHRPGGVFPGNMTTDDTFLNGLAPSLGSDPWGESCVSTADCTNEEDYVCEQDPQGDNRCRDKNPMRNIRMKVPAGAGVQLALVAGIVDVSMHELLPVLLPFLITGNGESFDFMAFVGSFDFHTLHVCPVTVDVPDGGEADITGDLALVSSTDCWNIEYQAHEKIVGFPSPNAAPEACTTNDDCGWPDSGMMCLDYQQNPGTMACLHPLDRVHIQSGDEVKFLPDFSGFDPTAPDADVRLQAGLPATAPYEELCPTATPGIYESCAPPRVHELTVPGDAECSLPYGLVLAAMDSPVGRVLIGFDFIHKRNYTVSNSKFLVPRSIMTGGVYLSVAQTFVRNFIRTDGGDLREVPGFTLSADRWEILTLQLKMPFLLPLPALDPPPDDAGLSTEITFIPEDPTKWPDPNIERVFATALGPRMPQAGVHEMAFELTESNLAGPDLKGVVLNKVDYAAGLTHVDPWWRVYAPAAAASIVLPESLSPFASGDDVWITPFGASFGVPFDYDGFPPDVLLGPLSRYSEDSWAVIVP
jgi:hypothetical protein